MIRRIRARFSVIISTALMTLVAFQSASAEQPAKTSDKSFYAEISVYSVSPGQGIESIDGDFSGSGFGPGGGFSTYIKRGERELELELQGRLKEGRFIVKLVASEEVGEKKEELPGLSIEFDLTDMVTKTIELGKDPNGRVHLLRLAPKVVKSPMIRRFNIAELRLEHFSFNDSLVILDDQAYLGTMSMSSGTLAYLDISGVAKVEFSLIPFKGATEQGRLDKSIIKIVHEGRTIEIRNALNGTTRSELQGGPFAVFVRWSAPTYSVEEAYQIQQSQLKELRAQMQSGQGTITAESLKVIEENIEMRKVSMSYGLGPITENDK